MSEVDISQGKARVVVEATIYGTYEEQSIRELRSAVIRTCRAIDNAAARALVDQLTENRSQ